MSTVDSIDTEALIVGAGPTGLVLAAELVRHGIRCRIIDSLASPSITSRALAIHARSVEVFDMMGIVDRFLNEGWRSYNFVVFDRKKAIVKMPFDRLDSRFSYVLCLPQFVTERILADHLSKLSVNIERSTTLTSLKQFDEFVEADLIKDDGTTETIKCRWLIGCDGAQSSVRRLLRLPFKGNTYWEQYVLADVKFETDLEIQDHYLFSSPEGIAGFHPFSSTAARVFADIGRVKVSRENDENMESVRAQFPEPSNEEMQEIFDRRGPGNVKLTNIHWKSLHRIHRRQVDSYKIGRVFLAGDAAHLHSPTSGQGMNIGIQDAFNLAWKLALVQRKKANESFLESYTNERRLVGKQVSTMSDFFSRINEVRSPIFQTIRNMMGPLIADQDSVKRIYRDAVSELATNYRLSEHVHDDVEAQYQRSSNDFGADEIPVRLTNCIPTRFENPLMAGDRVPDRNLIGYADGNTVRIYELLRNGKFHLFCFTGTQITPVIKNNFERVAELAETKYSDLIQFYIIGQTKRELNEFAGLGAGLGFGHGTDPGADADAHAERTFTTKSKQVIKLLDQDLTVHQSFANANSLYLIRPDGYVAFRSVPADASSLEHYLAAFF